MCGIAGIIDFTGSLSRIRNIFPMTKRVGHRGPDGEGYLLDTQEGLIWRDHSDIDHLVSESNSITNDVIDRAMVALGHRRLAIIDTSSKGHQPMSIKNGRAWIVYNGEVYNYVELREQLKGRGYSFWSNTDTEVILNAYLEWGEECLHRFNGMWAFAIVDFINKSVFCARDRIGIKPFYYYFGNGLFCFASEIKQLLVLPFVDKDLDIGVIYDYLVLSVVDHSDRTFLSEIKSLEPACFLKLSMKQGRPNQLVKKKYWHLDTRNKLNGLSDDEYAKRLYYLLEDSVKLRLRSDVPLGTCLSGGLDSSGIACLVNKLLKEKGSFENQKTFSSCFANRTCDERAYIEEVVRKNKVNNYKVFPQVTDLLNELDAFIWHLDQPFPSTSMYAQWCVFRLAKENGVTVTLDGQGADELLAGYHSYYNFFFASLFSKGHFGKLFREMSACRRLHGYTLRHLLRRLLDGLSFQRRRNVIAMHNRARTWCQEGFLDRGSRASPFLNILQQSFIEYGKNRHEQFLNKLIEMFSSTKLPSLLRYGDRSSMAHSVESRVPFLDYRLVEFSFAIPDDQKIKGGLTKYVYRKAMRGVIPEMVRCRIGKMGFPTPEVEWMLKAGEEIRNEIDMISDRNTVFNVRNLQMELNLYLTHSKPYDFLPWKWFNLVKWSHLYEVNL